MIDNFNKIGRLISGFTRKTVSSPREAWLLVRMAWWVTVLSMVARLYSLPRALDIVAGKGKVGRTGSTESELVRAIDLLLATDFLIFKPICWKRAAVLHRYLRGVEFQRASSLVCAMKVMATWLGMHGSNVRDVRSSKTRRQSMW